MSIAVSALIRPSRSLRALLAAYGLLNAGVALALLGAGDGADLVGSLACLVAAVLALQAWRNAKMTRQIDISGLGEVRLTVQQSMGSAGPQRHQVRLLPGSTLWPRCMFLLLRPFDEGRLTVLIICSDSVAPQAFRSIAVATRSIARRDNKFVDTNKIL